MVDALLDLRQLLKDYAPGDDGPIAGEMFILDGPGIHIDTCPPVRIHGMDDQTTKDDVFKELERARTTEQMILFHISAPTIKPLSSWFKMGAAVILKREGDQLIVEKDRHGQLGRRYDGLKLLHLADERDRIRELPGSSDQILYY